MDKKSAVFLAVFALIGLSWTIGLIVWRNNSNNPNEPIQVEDNFYISRIEGTPTGIAVTDTQSGNFSIDISYDHTGKPVGSVAGYDARLLFDESKLGDFVNCCIDLKAGDFAQYDGSSGDYLAECGLTEPQRVITISSDSGNSIAVSIGSKVSGSNYYFVKTSSSDTIYLVNSNYIQRLTCSVADLRTAQLFIDETTLQMPRIETIEVKKNSANEKLAFTADTVSSGSSEDIRYTITEPLNLSADSTSVNDLLLTPLFDMQNSAQLVKDYPKDLGVYGLDNPEYVVTYSDGTSSYSLLFSAEAGGKRYIMRSDLPAVFSAESSKTDFLSRKGLDFISPTFWQSRLTDISSIYIKTDEKTYNLSINIDENNLDNWSVFSGNVKADITHVAQIISYVKNAKFEIIQNISIPNPLFTFVVSIKGESSYTFNVEKVGAKYNVELVGSNKGFSFTEENFNDMAEIISKTFIYK